MREDGEGTLANSIAADVCRIGKAKRQSRHFCSSRATYDVCSGDAFDVVRFSMSLLSDSCSAVV